MNTAARWLRWGVAFVWLWTGLAVLYPHYRALGESYLAPLGVPPWVMYATCVAEVLLGLRVALGRAATWLTVLQVILIVGFTGILSATQRGLWFHPLGLLTKNLALLAMIGAAWLLERPGGGDWAGRLLLFGMALFWVADGFYTMIGRWNTALDEPVRRAVWALAFAEITAGVAILILRRGMLLRALVGICFVAVVLFTLLVTVSDPVWWLHPFGPLTKNVAVAVAAIVLLRCDEPRRPEGGR